MHHTKQQHHRDSGKLSPSSISSESKPDCLPLKSCLKKPMATQEGDTATKSTRRTAKRQRAIQFGHVHIRYHECELSDHPAVSYGAAVSIKWEFFDSKTFSVFDHDEERIRLRLRASRKAKRADSWDSEDASHGEEERNHRPTVLTPSERYLRLRNAGYTLEEIGKFAKRSRVVKQQRYRSASATTKELLACKLETIQNSIRKRTRRPSVLGGGGKKQTNRV
eukprot:CAMPEP_0194046286 /NCGR_PEP_ID=MMETSP0009_2-20130614/20214_1 /TAXON_ID=210454 /ORGANISM="Grammatophora oceanica, Strain CCMP 410" /LENGTH=221 /DNA_ID=CAMNT_0038691503 /DNA_START=167 /DNA_END=832 /DNA_ORIENTATION=+